MLLKSSSSEVVIANFGLNDPRVAQVMERKKIIIDQYWKNGQGFGLKNFHQGICIKERNIHLLEYRFPYRHMQRTGFFHAFFPSWPTNFA